VTPAEQRDRPAGCLFVTRELPLPPQTGSRQRALQLVHALRQRFALQVVADWGSAQDAATLSAEIGGSVALAASQATRPGLRDWGVALTRRTPLPMARHYRARLEDSVHRRVAEGGVDLVVVHNLHLATLAFGLRGVPWMVDFDNLEGVIWERYAALRPAPLRPIFRWAGAQIARYQSRVARAAVLTTCVSTLDAERLRRSAPGARVAVVPNAVAVPLSLPAYDANGGFLFVGALDWMANVDGLHWFLQTAWPQLQARFPDRAFEIVGRPPRRPLVFLNQPQVQVRGLLPDVEPSYARAAVAVVPLRIGGGTRIKILEAFAHGVPVVTTAVGAEGLDVVSGEHLLVADSAEGMAAAIQRLVTVPAEAERLRRGAFALVQNHHSADAVVRAVAALPLEDVVPGR
jgi:glycosyltransferase involved in cell wall biosynthesis